MIICAILVRVAVSVKRHAKIIFRYLDIKNCSCKKHLLDKLVLLCENEILNTTEASVDDKKVTYIIICLIIICFLLLVVVFISCNICHTKHWTKIITIS